MRDLLYLGSAPDVAGFTNDPQTGTKFDNNGDKLEVSQGLWGDYQTAAEDLAAKLVADPAQLAKLVPTGLPSDATAKARAFVAGFGERAYRRPLTAAELDSHVALFQQGAQLFPGGDAFTSGVQLLVQAMLQSPHFVYRVESGKRVGADGTVALDDYEDDVGRYRTQDSGQPVEGSASYSFSDGDQSYDGPIQWSQAMLQSVDSHACYVRHWLEFGFGRQAASGDEPLIARVAEASRMLGLPVKDLLVELVQSPSFQTRMQVKP